MKSIELFIMFQAVHILNMANNESQQKNRNCKKCRKIPKTGLKSERCGSESLPSSPKFSKNIIYNKNNKIICCECVKLVNGETINKGDLDNLVDDVGVRSFSNNHEVKIYYLKQLLTEKDCIKESFR